MIRRNEREKLLFLMALGAAVSLFLFLLVVVSIRSSDAGARETIRGGDATQVTGAVGSVALLTPERDVPSGTKLSTVELKEVYWPRDKVPEGAIRDLAEVKVMFAKVNLIAGQPVIRANLSDTSVRATLPLTKGYRAVSIEVDATSGLEGHALPGTRVDVTLTYMKDNNLTSKILIQNARVLSYGGDDKPLDQRELELLSGPARPSSTITLEVLPQDALKVQTARQLGRLSLIMRAPDDEVGSGPSEVDQGDLEGATKKATLAAGNCMRGRVKSDGREYLVDCDGNVNQILNNAE